MNLRFRIALGVAFLLVVATTPTTFAQKGFRPIIKPYTPPTYKVPNYTPPTYKVPNYTPPTYKVPGNMHGTPNLHFDPVLGKYTLVNPGYPQLRSHAELLAERQRFQANLLRTQIPLDPLSGFQKLGNTSELSAFDRTTLIEEAGVALAQKAKTTNQPLALLKEVRAVQQGTNKYLLRTEVPRINTQLEGTAVHLEQRCVTEALQKAVQLGEQGRWADAGGVAQEYLPNLRGAGEHVKALEGFQQIAGQLGALERVEVALKLPKGEAIQELANVPVQQVSAELQKPLRGIQAVQRLENALKKPWQSPPKQKLLDQKAIPVEAAQQLREATGDPALAARTLRELAAKAFLEGDPASARELLRQAEALGPQGEAAGNAPTDAAALLRDMKALVLGEGQVHTEPAQRAVTPPQNEGGDGTRGPPQGVGFLIPEGDRAGWRPPVVGPALEELPPLLPLLREQLPKFHQVAETRAQTERKTITEKQQVTLAQARPFTQPGLPLVQIPPIPQKLNPMGQQQDDEEAMLKLVALHLGRPLTMAEQIQARQLIRQRLGVAAIVAVLNKKVVAVP